MDYLTLAEEFDSVVDVGVVGEAKDIVVGDTRLLLCREVLLKIGDAIPLRGYCHRREGLARRRAGVDAVAVSDEVFVEAACLDLSGGEVSRELIDYRGYHFCVAEFLRADVGENSDDLTIRHSISLVEVSRRRAELTVGTAEGIDYDTRELS